MTIEKKTYLADGTMRIEAVINVGEELPIGDWAASSEVRDSAGTLYIYSGSEWVKQDISGGGSTPAKANMESHSYNFGGSHGYMFAEGDWNKEEPACAVCFNPPQGAEVVYGSSVSAFPSCVYTINYDGSWFCASEDGAVYEQAYSNPSNSEMFKTIIESSFYSEVAADILSKMQEKGFSGKFIYHTLGGSGMVMAMDQYGGISTDSWTYANESTHVLIIDTEKNKVYIFGQGSMGMTGTNVTNLRSLDLVGTFIKKA